MDSNNLQDNVLKKKVTSQSFNQFSETTVDEYVEKMKIKAEIERQGEELKKAEKSSHIEQSFSNLEEVKKDNAQEMFNQSPLEYLENRMQEDPIRKYEREEKPSESETVEKFLSDKASLISAPKGELRKEELISKGDLNVEEKKEMVEEGKKLEEKFENKSKVAQAQKSLGENVRFKDESAICEKLKSQEQKLNNKKYSELIKKVDDFLSLEHENVQRQYSYGDMYYEARRACLSYLEDKKAPGYKDVQKILSGLEEKFLAFEGKIQNAVGDKITTASVKERNSEPNKKFLTKLMQKQAKFNAVNDFSYRIIRQTQRQNEVLNYMAKDGNLKKIITDYDKKYGKGSIDNRAFFQFARPCRQNEDGTFPTRLDESNYLYNQTIVSDYRDLPPEEFYKKYVESVAEKIANYKFKTEQLQSENVYENFEELFATEFEFLNFQNIFVYDKNMGDAFKKFSPKAYEKARKMANFTGFTNMMGFIPSFVNASSSGNVANDRREKIGLPDDSPLKAYIQTGVVPKIVEDDSKFKEGDNLDAFKLIDGVYYYYNDTNGLYAYALNNYISDMETYKKEKFDERTPVSGERHENERIKKHDEFLEDKPLQFLADHLNSKDVKNQERVEALFERSYERVLTMEPEYGKDIELDQNKLGEDFRLFVEMTVEDSKRKAEFIERLDALDKTISEYQELNKRVRFFELFLANVLKDEFKLHPELTKYLNQYCDKAVQKVQELDDTIQALHEDLKKEGKVNPESGLFDKENGYKYLEKGQERDLINQRISKLVSEGMNKAEAVKTAVSEYKKALPKELKLNNYKIGGQDYNEPDNPDIVEKVEEVKTEKKEVIKEKSVIKEGKANAENAGKISQKAKKGGIALDDKPAWALLKEMDKILQDEDEASPLFSQVKTQLENLRELSHSKQGATQHDYAKAVSLARIAVASYYTKNSGMKWSKKGRRRRDNTRSVLTALDNLILSRDEETRTLILGNLGTIENVKEDAVTQELFTKAREMGVNTKVDNQADFKAEFVPKIEEIKKNLGTDFDFSKIIASFETFRRNNDGSFPTKEDMQAYERNMFKLQDIQSATKPYNSEQLDKTTYEDQFEFSKDANKMLIKKISFHYETDKLLKGYDITDDMMISGTEIESLRDVLKLIKAHKIQTTKEGNALLREYRNLLNESSKLSNRNIMLAQNVDMLVNESDSKSKYNQEIFSLERSKNRVAQKELLDKLDKARADIKKCFGFDEELEARERKLFDYQEAEKHGEADYTAMNYHFSTRKLQDGYSNSLSTSTGEKLNTKWKDSNFASREFFGFISGYQADIYGNPLTKEDEQKKESDEKVIDTFLNGTREEQYKIYDKNINEMISITLKQLTEMSPPEYALRTNPDWYVRFVNIHHMWTELFKNPNFKDHFEEFSKETKTAVNDINEVMAAMGNYLGPVMQRNRVHATEATKLKNSGELRIMKQAYEVGQFMYEVFEERMPAAKDAISNLPARKKGRSRNKNRGKK